MPELKGADLYESTAALFDTANALDKLAEASTDANEQDELFRNAQSIRNAAGQLAADALITLVGENAVTAEQINAALKQTAETLKQIAKVADALKLAVQIVSFFSAVLTGNLGKIWDVGQKLSEAKKAYDKKYPAPATDAPAAVG